MVRRNIKVNQENSENVNSQQQQTRDKPQISADGFNDCYCRDILSEGRFLKYASFTSDTEVHLVSGMNGLEFDDKSLTKHSLCIWCQNFKQNIFKKIHFLG